MASEPWVPSVFLILAVVGVGVVVVVAVGVGSASMLLDLRALDLLPSA